MKNSKQKNQLEEILGRGRSLKIVGLHSSGGAAFVDSVVDDVRQVDLGRCDLILDERQLGGKLVDYGLHRVAVLFEHLLGLFQWVFDHHVGAEPHGNLSNGD